LNNGKGETENSVILLEFVDPTYDRLDAARRTGSFVNLAVVRRRLG
jgi:hypothetical protein